jgi:hypothetical protein
VCDFVGGSGIARDVVDAAGFELGDLLELGEVVEIGVCGAIVCDIALQ